VMTKVVAICPHASASLPVVILRAAKDLGPAPIRPWFSHMLYVAQHDKTVEHIALLVFLTS